MTTTVTYWDINDKPRLKYTVLDADGVATDPSTVKLRVVSPGATTTNYTYAGATITKLSTGVYYVDLLVQESGGWEFRWETTVPETAEEGSLVVRAATVPKIN